MITNRSVLCCYGRELSQLPKTSIDDLEKNRLLDISNTVEVLTQDWSNLLQRIVGFSRTQKSIEMAGIELRDGPMD